MSKIGNAFKNGKAFIGFLTAGDPSLEDTLRFMKAMERGGADLIELGIPFSDPIAEGIVIQEADLRALEHNTSVDDAFHVVEEFRKESDLPVVFMGYVNPIFNYGYDRFSTSVQILVWMESLCRMYHLKNVMNLRMWPEPMESILFL